MARYQYVYGLKPIGPHYPLAGKLLTPLRVNCPRCDYAGILNYDEGEKCGACPVCEGTGGFWGAPDDVVEALRKSIIDKFPDAVAPPVRFLGVPLALQLPENVMTDFSDTLSPRKKRIRRVPRPASRRHTPLRKKKKR
jgi:hypothetical protein